MSASPTDSFAPVTPGAVETEELQSNPLGSTRTPEPMPDTTNDTDQVRLPARDLCMHQKLTSPAPCCGFQVAPAAAAAAGRPESHASASTSVPGIKYFIIRSNCQENVDISLQEGAWSTTHGNEQRLNVAFRTAPEVRLLFSVTSSSAFQGYAVMRTPTGRLGRPMLWSGGRSFGSPFAGTMGCF